MSVLELNVYSRDLNGKKTKIEGFIPAIIYGNPKGKEVKIKYNEFERFYNKTKGQVNAIKLIIDEKDSEMVIIKEIQKNSLGVVFLHVDFQPLEKGHVIQIELPVVLKGTSVGEKAGGFLEQNIHKVKVEVLPSKLVDKIELDISDLDVGQSLHLRDINIDGVKVLDRLEDTIVTVLGKASASDEEEGEEETSEA